MRKQPLILLLTLTLATLASCGGHGGTATTHLGSTESGSLAIFAADQPLCDVVSFQVTLTGITLMPQAGGTPVSVLSSGQSITVDFASLMDFASLLNLASVPPGTYSQATLTISNPQLTVMDASQTPPSPTDVPATLNSLTLTIDINPPLTVTSGGTTGLNLDFNLRQSVLTDTNGLVTGEVDPVMAAIPAILSSDTGLGEIEDLHGLVQSISTAASGSFTGSLVVQTAGGANFTVNVTNSTVFDGATGLDGIQPGTATFVEVRAYVDSSGNIVAERVTVEEQEDLSVQKAAFLGLITSVAPRLATGAAAQFTMVVREEFPLVGSGIPLLSNVTVNIQPTTHFFITSSEANFAGLTFDATNIGVGQAVVVHGNFQPGIQGVLPTVNASSVYLRLQTVAGNYSQLLAVGADGLSGGFDFTPCAGIYQGQALSVITSADTSFEGVSTLSGLTSTPTLLIKGVTLYEPALTSADSVPVTPPSMVVLAEKVHELP